MSKGSKQQMFTGALWAGAGKLLSMPMSLVTAMVLARALKAADYGAYFVAVSTVLILTGVSAMGMDQVVIRLSAMQLARNRHEGWRRGVLLCIGVVAGFALIVALLVILGGPWLFSSLLGMPSLSSYAWLLATWIFFAALQRQLAETFRGLNDIRMATLAGGMRSLGILNSSYVCLAMVVLWCFGALSLFTALLCTLAASMVIVLQAGLILWRRLARAQPATGEAVADDAAGDSTLKLPWVLREGWPLALAGLVATLNNTGSAWLASPLDTASHVALYGVAQRLVVLLIAPMTIINAVLPPIVADLHSKGRTERLEHVVRSIAGLVLMVSCVLLAILVFAGRPLLHLLFGAYYEQAYPLMILLCVGQVVNIATGAWQVVLPMTGNKHQLLGSMLIALSVQVVLGFGLGYRFGVLGVAIAYCSSMIVTNLAGMMFAHRRLGIWTYASLSLRTARDAASLVRERMMRKLAWQSR